MPEANPNTRLEMFSEGVFAIALILLIIDIKITRTVKVRSTEKMWMALRHILPSILAFVLSSPLYL